nr:AI-2E family transporter [Cytophagales bacterium]
MENRSLKILRYTALLLITLTLFFWGVVAAKGFLAPLTVGMLLTMVILPVSKWLEGKGISRGLAAFFSTLVTLSFFLLILGILAWQVNNFADDWQEIKDRIEPKVEQVKQFITNKTGMSPQEQEEMLFGPQQSPTQPNQESSESTSEDSSQTVQKNPSIAGISGVDGSMVKSVGGYALSVFSLFGNFLLTFIYVFFFLLYRKKFTKALMKAAPNDKKDKAKETMDEIILISQNYLFGRLLLILFLAVLYSVGLSISGVDQAILIALLAAVLSLIPYVGNIVGFGLAVIMAFVSGSGLAGFIGVGVTFGVAQFVESYILEPYVVGNKVNVNPVFTIIVVVLGGAIWGVTGMLVAIPALGMLKVIFDRIPSLEPLGYLFGEEDISDDNEPGPFDKIVAWVKEKFSSDS